MSPTQLPQSHKVRSSLRRALGAATEQKYEKSHLFILVCILGEKAQNLFVESVVLEAMS
jgi:TPP-dependent pyruvate/acetoin dehydrogenase alpha subunit